jgi:hypothetical protein
VTPFPTSAASHAACGFTALRAPAQFDDKGYGAYQDGAVAGDDCGCETRYS